jgi:hypothetical protein
MSTTNHTPTELPEDINKVPKAASQPIGAVSQDAHEKEVMMKAFDKVRDLFEKRSWIMEGRGSYPYNDDRYKEEVRYMYDEFDALFKDTWANIKSKSFEYRQQIIAQYLKENPPGGAVWVKASEYKLPHKEAEHRPYRVKSDYGYDYGEIYISWDEEGIFLDIDNENEYLLQTDERWSNFEILDETPSPTAAGDVWIKGTNPWSEEDKEQTEATAAGDGKEEIDWRKKYDELKAENEVLKEELLLRRKQVDAALATYSNKLSQERADLIREVNNRDLGENKEVE